MNDWTEFTSFSQRLSQRKIKLQKKAETKKQRRIEKARPHFIEQFLKWDKLLIFYLRCVSKELNSEESCFKSFINLCEDSEGYKAATKEDANRIFDIEVDHQLNGETTIFKWSTSHFRVELYFTNFSLVKIVVKGSNSYKTNTISETKFKKLMLKAYSSGPGEFSYFTNETEHEKREKKETKLIYFYNSILYRLPLVLSITELTLFILTLSLFFGGDFQQAISVLLICVYVSLVSLRFKLSEMSSKTYSVWNNN